MRVSEQLLKLYWLSVFTVALSAVSNLSIAMGQIVVPATEHLSDDDSSTAAGMAPPAANAKEWLTQARQAILDRDFQRAEQFIQVAEELDQQQPTGSQLNYTPAMARQELADMRARTTPTTTTASNTASNPGKAFPASAINVPQVSSEDIQNAARRALLKSRQALAHGDVETATAMANSAKQYQVDFEALGDSPKTLEMMIFHQNNLSALAAAKDKTYNQRAAMFLLQQAQSLIAYEDYETAAGLINQAKSFPVEFTSGPQHPDTLMAQIQSAQQTTPANDTKATVMKLMSQAQFAVDQGQWEQAKRLVDQAKACNLPDSEFAADETRPWQLELQITQALNMQTFADNKAEIAQTNFTDDDSSKVVQADYDPTTDTTHNVQVTGYDPQPAETAAPDTDDRLAKFPEFNPIPSRGMQLYRSGLQAMDNDDTDHAKEYFEMAWRFQDQLDPATRQSIQDHLSNMTASNGARTGAAENLFSQETGQIPASDVRGSQQAMFRKLQGEVMSERAAAERLLETSPREALEKMTMVRSRIAQSEIDPDSRRPLLTIIDRDIAQFQKYIEKNLPEIINDETNADRMQSVDLRRQRSVDVEMQIQKLVEDFNRLIEEERFAEAEMVARQAHDLSPDSEIVAALTTKAQFLTRVLRMNDLKDRSEKGVWDALRNVQESAAAMDFDTPILFDKDRFEERAAMRASQLGLNEYDSEAERKIWNLLKNQKVQGEYSGTLSSAVEQLSRQAGVNIIFDKIALAAEGVELDSTVDVPIREPISLQSALKVILGSAGLVFVVQDEVIKVTSRDAQQRDVKAKTYYVGDLVMPITNFSSTMQMNFMQPSSSYSNQNFNNNQLGGGPLTMPPVAQSNPSSLNGLSIAQQSAMAQQLPGGLPRGFGVLDNYQGSMPQTGTPTYSTIGPQRLGGVTEADFFPLIELIKTTINPDSWDDSNGDGTIQAFVPNLSLIVSQTQEVQDQIQDLLKKLRELNDVQIVIEVRFITLQDNFFERVGVDFDFQINDNSNLTNPIPDKVNPSAIIGNTATGPTADLDVVFDQDSFASAIPQFGGFDVGTAANFGFAILSDIEVYFLIQASKGDTRSNIMQAPTVTMFNGQSANVTDGALRPFVTSVTPVVGDFAVAQQPVITILPDGTSLNVQAVVSNDRRFVRMTLVPFFSQVQSVSTFTFDGSTTTRRATNSLLEDLLNSVNGSDTDPDQVDEIVTETSGVTIQLPVLATTSVSTVVSVPDGGTVLMGGIKRMSEGRTERGVPFLSNIPYVNRLFKNVGIGRDTSNLMMMVTPRIIIQAEEEQLQVGELGSGG